MSAAANAAGFLYIHGRPLPGDRHEEMRRVEPAPVRERPRAAPPEPRPAPRVTVTYRRPRRALVPA